MPQSENVVRMTLAFATDKCHRDMMSYVRHWHLSWQMSMSYVRQMTLCHLSVRNANVVHTFAFVCVVLVFAAMSWDDKIKGFI